MRKYFRGKMGPIKASSLTLTWVPLPLFNLHSRTRRQYQEVEKSMRTWTVFKSCTCYCGPWLSDSGSQFPQLENVNSRKCHWEGYCEAPMRWCNAWHSVDNKLWQIVCFHKPHRTELDRILEITESRFQTTLRRCLWLHLSTLFIPSELLSIPGTDSTWDFICCQERSLPTPSHTLAFGARYSPIHYFLIFYFASSTSGFWFWPG